MGKTRTPYPAEFRAQMVELVKAVRPFIGPAHLSLLCHTVADDLVHGRFGDAAVDRQALAMPGAVVHQRARVVLQVTGDSVQIPPINALLLPLSNCSGPT